MIAIVEESTYKVPAVICDLDGTLALKHNDRTWYDASTCDRDVINTPIKTLIDLMWDSHHIIFCSAREEKFREPTMTFLDKCFNGKLDNHDFDLFMRQTNDYRKDSIVKHEIYLNQIKPNWNVNFVLDDRRQVVDMWRNALGLTTLQVAEGNF